MKHCPDLWNATQIKLAEKLEFFQRNIWIFLSRNLLGNTQEWMSMSITLAHALPHAKESWNTLCMPSWPPSQLLHWFFLHEQLLTTLVGTLCADFVPIKISRFAEFSWSRPIFNGSWSSSARRFLLPFWNPKTCFGE